MFIAKNEYVELESLERVTDWFRQFGETDEGYLSAHYDRYVRTMNFALRDVGERKLDILDLGSHWLHNAFFYAGRGHRLIGADAPDLMSNSAVLAAAEVMNIKLRSMRRMEIGDGIQDLENESVDLVLFCEIIEHMAFNPIPFWKQIYRILRPGGRIVVTTPNSMYFRSLAERIPNVLNGSCLGPSIDEIMSQGTYGHHWKEFTISELHDYFHYLSPDFDTSRFEFVAHDADLGVPLGALENHIARFTDVRAYNIYLDVCLPHKNSGITVSPPWIPL